MFVWVKATLMGDQAGWDYSAMLVVAGATEGELAGATAVMAAAVRDRPIAARPSSPWEWLILAGDVLTEFRARNASAS